MNIFNNLSYYSNKPQPKVKIEDVCIDVRTNKQKVRDFLGKVGEILKGAVSVLLVILPFSIPFILPKYIFESTVLAIFVILSLAVLGAIVVISFHLSKSFSKSAFKRIVITLFVTAIIVLGIYLFCEYSSQHSVSIEHYEHRPDKY